MNQEAVSARRRWMRVVAVVVGVVGIMVVAAISLIARVHWKTECENAFISESPSPDGARKIVVFERDCGATTGFSTQASLLKSDQSLPTAAGNIYIADDNHGAVRSGPGGGPPLGIRWKSPRAVVLTGAAGARVFLAKEQVEDVQIEYAPAH